ncbi:flagellar basal body P-ring biosynthesis protein FlgA [Hartmannibacter diazotrophicus]|uniref:Flagellar basal body P-ring biosynthesis protein FlgA n=1 Tax=Hartmannibacter diazotrophicus TaxID=1482074 RepID=A0A2C9D7D8_9HYPH|nr:flagellar basal body P-ring formation chaperone FlgA [Hartmannibacter diazotrophicus]SON56217.1 flagellar basal body P-ring biosynthesis protein FlgA [Hartmannibacter diazotrophicus]
MTRSVLFRLACASVLGGALAAFIAHPADASARLKETVLVSGRVVTLGDLFDDAGDLAAKPVFRAPDPGVAGALSARDALAAAAAAGLADTDADGLTTITVERRSQTVDASMLADVVTEALALRLGARQSDLDVAFDVTPQTMAVAADGYEAPRLQGLSYQPSSGRFSGEILINAGAHERTLPVTGVVAEMVEVAVLGHSVNRGDIVNRSDLETTRMDRRRVARDAISSTDRIIGLAARRTLRAGDALTSSDFEEPKLVARNSLVTVNYNKPGLTLSARGRALADGARGDLVSVLNEQSRRVIHGIVTGPGEIEIAAEPITTAANETAIAAKDAVQ